MPRALLAPGHPDSSAVHARKGGHLNHQVVLQHLLGDALPLMYVVQQDTYMHDRG